jgi:hypothetical protein
MAAMGEPLDLDAVLADLDAPEAGRPGSAARARLGRPGGGRALVGWIAAISLVVGIGLFGSGGLLDPAGRGDEPAAIASPSAPATVAPDPAEVDPAIAVPTIGLLGVDLPLGTGRYGQAAVVASVRVFGQVRDAVASPEPEAPGGLTVTLADGWGAVLGSGSADPAPDGRFEAEVRFAPPARERHVTIHVADAVTGRVLAELPYVVPTRGSVAFWSPERLDGWHGGDAIVVEALIPAATPQATVRLVDDAGRVHTEAIVRGVAHDGSWSRVATALEVPSTIIPPTATGARLWLEVEAAANGDTDGATGRLLLGVRRQVEVPLPLRLWRCCAAVGPVAVP